MFTLRPYQQDNYYGIQNGFRRWRRVLYQAGTGSGKTVTASRIIHDTQLKGNRVLFAAHRREIVDQTTLTLHEMGCSPGVIMAERRLALHAQVQVASIDTLRARFFNDSGIKLLSPKLLVIDEAHRSLSATYLALIDMFPRAFVLGLSATPARSDGRGLGHVYQYMVKAPSVAELIEQGFLVQPRYFVGPAIERKGLRTSSSGDWVRDQVEERSMDNQLIGDCVENWLRHAKGRATFTFAAGVKHSLALEEQFRLAGVRAKHIDGNTHTWERDDAVKDLREGRLDIITNAQVFTEGTDVPIVSCIQNAQATKSIAQYFQKGGRGMRTHEESGKVDMLYLDHGHTIDMHGYLEDPVPWTLDTEGDIRVLAREARSKQPKDFICSFCGCSFSGRLHCPECNTKIELRGEWKDATDDELMEMVREDRAPGRKAKRRRKEHIYTEAEMQQFYSELLGYCHEKGKAKGFAFHTFRAKFGVKPEGFQQVMAEPSDITLSYITHRNIRFAKEQRRKQQ